jgi:hypothetical protein
MKRNTILAGLLVSTVASEAVHTPLDAHPHIECDVKVSQPSTVAAPISIGGGTAKVDDETLGHFRWRMFHRKMLRANRATWADKDELAMFDAYLETARAVVDHYPSLKLWERQHQYNCFRSEIELTKLRTRGCRDFSSALPAIAHVLGVAGCRFHDGNSGGLY